ELCVYGWQAGELEGVPQRGGGAIGERAETDVPAVDRVPAPLEARSGRRGALRGQPDGELYGSTRTDHRAGKAVARILDLRRDGEASVERAARPAGECHEPGQQVLL